MCTVSIIPMQPALGGPGVRLASNRDESRLRPPASLPQLRSFGERRALMPIDPVSQGTWVAVNDAGLAMTLMNIYPRPFDPAAGAASSVRYVSRGTIIPSLLQHATLEAAVCAVEALDPADFPDFRLLLVDATRFAEVLSADGRLVVSGPVPVDRPIMYASSGLGDAVVDAPRRALFESIVSIPDGGISAQDAFHQHCWPDRPHLSVCMSRPEARTVSLTVVEIGPDRSRMIYYPESPHQPIGPVVMEVDRGPGTGANGSKEKP